MRIVEQVATRDNPVNQREPAGGAVAHGDRGRAIQFHHRRRVEPQHHVVESDDLRPVGRGRRGRFRVHRSDRRLQRIRTGTARLQRALHEREPLRHERTIPLRAILVVEQHHVAVRRLPGGATRVVEDH